MKGRMLFLFFTLMFLLLLISGCQFAVPTINGPAWTTKVSVPLIMKTLASDGASYSELRFDGKANGKGESNPYLVGLNLWDFGISPMTINGGEFGYITISSGVSFGNLTLPALPAQGTIPAGAPGATVDLGDYSGFTLSDNGSPYNTITTTIAGGATAGTNGLTITFSNGIDTRTATIPNGGTTVDLTLTGLEITSSLSITISGDYDNTSGSGYVQFNVSDLQVSQFTVDGSQLSAVASNLTFDTSQEIKIPIGGTIVAQLSALEVTLDGPDLPQNLIGTMALTVDGQDDSGISVLSGGAKTYNDITIQRGSPYTVVLTTDINEIFLNKPANLVIKVSSISFSGAPGQNVIIKNTDKIALKITPKIGFQSITTNPQEMSVDKIVQNTVQSAALNFKITNNTPLGLTLKVYLAPDSDTKTNSKRVEFTLTIPSSTPGVPKTADSKLNITAAQLADLTATGSVWNQIEITAAETTQSVQADPPPYLEIRSFAQAELLVKNPQ